MEIKSVINKFTIYQYMISFLAVLIIVSSFFYDFGLEALVPVIIAVLTTTLLDGYIEYFKSKTWMFSQSAMISGLFIGGLLTQGLQWYVYVIAGVIAILAKHLLNFEQKHIFNPAIFGVLIVSIAFGAQHSWWVSSPLILVLMFGIFIIWRLRRFDLTLAFLSSYYIINSVIELLKGSGLNEIYFTLINGGVIYFFAMFMLIEPRTNPAQKRQRIVYGIFVALLLIGMQQYGILFKNSLAGFFTKHDLPLALAVGNIFVPLLNKIKMEFWNKPPAKT